MTKRYGHLIEHWNAAKDEMRTILIRCAREKRTITYGELSAEIQAASIHPYSYAMANMLDEIGYENMAQGKTALPTLVVRKSDGRPGPGFFRKSYASGASGDDLEQFWQEQFARVCEEWKDG